MSRNLGGRSTVRKLGCLLLAMGFVQGRDADCDMMLSAARPLEGRVLQGL
jgi:hypothetical protein